MSPRAFFSSFRAYFTAPFLGLSLAGCLSDEPAGEGDNGGGGGKSAEISFEAVKAPEGAKTFTGNGITFNYPERYDNVEVDDNAVGVFVHIMKTAGPDELMDETLTTITLMKREWQTAEEVRKEYLDGNNKHSSDKGEEATRKLMGADAVGYTVASSTGSGPIVQHSYYLDLEHVGMILNVEYIESLSQDPKVYPDVAMVIDSLRGAKK